METVTSLAKHNSKVNDLIVEMTENTKECAHGFRPLMKASSHFLWGGVSFSGVIRRNFNKKKQKAKKTRTFSLVVFP